MLHQNIDVFARTKDEAGRTDLIEAHVEITPHKTTYEQKYIPLPGGGG
jgi:hypothetical protein